MKFTKKPVEIEAMQFIGGWENASDILLWIASDPEKVLWREVVGQNADGKDVETMRSGKHSWFSHQDEMRTSNGEIYQLANPEHLSIYTLEGVMCADVGDWIIKGVKGEFYPCKPDIFEMTYTPSTDSGLARVTAERQRQIDVEGYSPAGDAGRVYQLATAGAAYALHAVGEPGEDFFPWSKAYWKPSDRLRDLEKAGALILAAIDSLLAEEHNV